MKKTTKVAISLFAIAIASVFISEYTSRANSYAEGPPAGETGSPGDGSDCTSCHSQTSITSSASITSNIPSSGFISGQTYTITGTVISSGKTRFGFEISPQTSNGTEFGSIAVIDATNTQIVSTKYIEHTLAGTSGTTGSHTWSFSWTAPGSASATAGASATFYGAFVTGGNTNSNDTDAGDYVTVISRAFSENTTASVNISASATTLCTGTNVTFTASATNGGTSPSYQWQVNGNNVGTNDTAYSATSIANGDIVTCVLTSNKTGVIGSPATSNSLTMTVNATVDPSVSIAVTSGSGSICSGQSVTFTVTPGNGGSTPSYQWQVNNNNTGTNSTTYSSTSLANGDMVTCILSSNAVCATPVTVTSNTVTMTVNPVVTPSVSIAITKGTNPSCSGQSVMFTATPANGGTSPNYQWQVNGNDIGTDNDTMTFILNNGDIVKCILTSTVVCATTTTATSNAITMDVSSVLTPSVSIAITGGNNPSCIGQPVTLTAKPSNGGTKPGYQWQMDGNTVGTDSSSYIAIFTNGQTISCIMNSNSVCANPTTAASNTVTVTTTPNVKTDVAISTSTGNDTTCMGCSLTFTATPTNGGTSPAYQWQIDGNNVGTNNYTYTTSALTNGQQISCIMTSTLSCANQAMDTITIIVIPTVTQNGNVLTSSSLTGNQWYYNGNLISGATGQTYVATQSGIYKVVVASGNGSVTSTPLKVISTGIEQLSEENNISVFPNPNDGNFTIMFNALTSDTYTLEINNMLGQIVYEETLNNFAGNYNKQLNIKESKGAIYFVTLTSSINKTITKVVIY